MYIANSRMSLNSFYAVSLLLVYSLIGCADNFHYVGDGEFEVLNAPLLGNDGVLITFPVMSIGASHAGSFSVSHFPKKGKYLIYLSLKNKKSYKKIDYRLEVYKNGNLMKVLDSHINQTFEESGTGFHGIYFSSLDSKLESSLEVNKLDDEWLFKVDVMQPQESVSKLEGNILLRVGGRK